MEQTNKYKDCKSLDDLIEAEYGAVGTPDRDQFEEETQAFMLAETLKMERLAFWGTWKASLCHNSLIVIKYSSLLQFDL